MFENGMNERETTHWIAFEGGPVWFYCKVWVNVYITHDYLKRHSE